MINLNCNHCQAPISKLKRDFNRSKTKLFYCNRSCASSSNGKQHPKRKKTVFFHCEICRTEIVRGRRFCPDHSTRNIDYGSLSADQLQAAAKYQKSAMIRTHARAVYFETHSTSQCEKCPYNKHIEVCHKKAIKSFSPDTKLSEINHPDNLIGLCRNCHWELDHNL